MKLKQIYLFGVLFCLNSCLMAQNYDYSGKCKFEYYMLNFEKCLTEELIKYDKQLNDEYKKLAPNKDLRAVESLWVKFKEADCDYIATKVNEGKYYDRINKACLVNLTKERIAHLQRSFFFFGWFDKTNAH